MEKHFFEREEIKKQFPLLSQVANVEDDRNVFNDENLW